jgi:hypothetical protein
MEIGMACGHFGLELEPLAGHVWYENLLEASGTLKTWPDLRRVRGREVGIEANSHSALDIVLDTLIRYRVKFHTHRGGCIGKEH